MIPYPDEIQEQARERVLKLSGIGLMNCPNGHGPMQAVTVNERLSFRGREYPITMDVRECPACGLRASTDSNVDAIRRHIRESRHAS